MKIRRINLTNGNFVRIGDFVTESHEAKEYEVTGFRLFDGGYSVYHNELMVAWIPFHSVTMVFLEVENEF